MKSSLIFGLAAAAMFMSTQGAAARERSFDEMQAAAQSILQQNGGNKVRAIATAPMKVMGEFSQMDIFGYTDGGFVLVSKNDQIPAVLGYSDGTFDAAAQNPNLASYLEMLNGYINYCVTNNQEFRIIRRAGGANESVAPLVKTKWDQTKPYYNQCPITQNQHCVTGCVATAAAQILNYYQLPNVMHGKKIYTYVDDLDARQRIVYDYDGVTFDWDNMKNSYLTNYSTATANAVANLMYCCGVSASMDYSTGESGGWPSTIADAINWFMDGLHSEYNLLSGLEQRVYDELDAGHPILYSGYTTEGGHAFVIDGYDSNSFIHCNMGWSGGGDGYYALTDMNGYSSSQEITTIDPSEELNYTHQPCADVPAGNVTVRLEPATEIIPDTQWYLLYNVGRCCHPYSSGKAQTIMTTCYLPYDAPDSVAAPHIVRFVTSTNAKKPGYFIQTGDGFYFGSLEKSDNKGTTTSKTTNYSYGKIKDGYFWFHDEKNDFMMDSNTAGKSLCGWGQTIPTDTTANSSWQVFPVEFTVPVGINEVSAGEENISSYYDLQGRPVARPERGQIYIRSRKKVMMK